MGGQAVRRNAALLEIKAAKREGRRVIQPSPSIMEVFPPQVASVVGGEVHFLPKYPGEGITMKGNVYAYGPPCPRCGGDWQSIKDPVTGDVINILCPKCFTMPVRFAIDGRAFKNRRGTVGRIFRDERGELFYHFQGAKRVLESIRHAWDTEGKERFDPTKHSKDGRETYKLAECAREWQLNLKERGKKDATIAHAELNFRLHILPILGSDVDVREITEDDIERLQRELKKKDGIGDNAVKGCLQNLRTLLKRYHERKHVLTTLPAFPEGWSASIYVERHEVTVPEQRRLMARLVMSYPKRVRKPMLLLQQVYTALGCRPGEAHGLRREDILEDGRVKIQGAIDPKTGLYGPRKTKDSRTTPDPLPEGLLAELRALPVIGRGYLFVGEDGKPWNQNRVTDRFKDICDVENVTYYTYSKHSLASRIASGEAEGRKDRAAKVVGVTKRILESHYLIRG
jgi:integrase